jgi:hypothetical protein
VAKEFPPSDFPGTLNLFDGLTPVVAPDGHHVFYKKGTASPLFARSLDGDITNNPDESLVTGCVMVFEIVPTARGIYYVACHDQANPLALRYFEFASRRSFDLGPPPLGTNSDGLSGRPASRLFHGAARQRRVDARHLPLGGTVTQRPPVVKAA